MIYKDEFDVMHAKHLEDNLPDDYMKGKEQHLINPTQPNKKTFFGLMTNKVHDSFQAKRIKEQLEFDDVDIAHIMSDGMLTTPEAMFTNRYNSFSRYGYLDSTELASTREYLFFSKPDLHLVNTKNPSMIYGKLAEIPFFDEAFRKYKQSYYSLQQYYGGESSLVVNGTALNLQTKYINLLSNMVTSSLDLPDINSTEVSNNQNLYQINTSYREGSITSDLQYDFSLEFKDDKYMDVYMLFKIYDEYFRTKYTTTLYPTRQDYIFNKIYPEALSIWKIIVDDTGRIMYWAKATGCTPMSVPRGTISNIDGNIKFTVNWKAQFIRDMDPVNLVELNNLTLSSMTQTQKTSLLNNFDDRIMRNRKIGNPDTPGVSTLNNTTWAQFPIILPNKTDTRSIRNHRSGQHTLNNADGFYTLAWI